MRLAVTARQDRRGHRSRRRAAPQALYLPIWPARACAEDAAGGDAHQPGQ